MNRACVLSALLLVMACAHTRGSGEQALPSGNRDTAQRLYMVAEERYAAGDFDEAVSLMRHSLLQLPPTADHDRLRHQLVLRMGHTQLRAHDASGQAAPLHDARQMLERYLVRHEELFGDGRKARAERGEVYELLHLVEQRIEPTTIDLDASDDDAATSTAIAAAGSNETAPGAETVAALDAAAEPATTKPATTKPAPARAQAPARRHTDAQGNQVRDLVVPEERRLASLDDPRVMDRLRSPFSTGWLGGVLTTYGVTEMHPARPLVRGRSRLAGDGDRSRHQLARRAGQSLLRDARPDLRECYAAAYARQPVAALDSAVEASIHPDGSISHVRIVDGGLVDGHGDACLIEALEATTVAPLEEAAEPVRVQVALTFFYEGALYINEGTGEQVHSGGVFLQPAIRRLDGLPPIETGAGVSTTDRHPRRRVDGSSRMAMPFSTTIQPGK